MRELLIIGARGFGREAFHIFLTSRLYRDGEVKVKGFLDDDSHALDNLNGDWPPILGPVESYEIKENDVFFCAMGDSHCRKHYADIIENKGGRFISIIHRAALIDPSATIKEGSIVGALACISANVTIGKHVLIQAFSDLGHDSSIGDFATIGAYVFLGGGASVGTLSTMQTKSSILPHKSVGQECMVGIGSVVMKNFKDGVHVFGNPARITDL